MCTTPWRDRFAAGRCGVPKSARIALLSAKVSATKRVTLNLAGRRQSGEQGTPDAVMLPAIGDDEGDLRRLRALAEPIEAGDGDDGFLAVDHDQRVAVDVIDVREALELGRRQVRVQGEEPVTCRRRESPSWKWSSAGASSGDMSRPPAGRDDRARRDLATGCPRDRSCHSDRRLEVPVIGSLAAAPIEAMLCSPSSMNRPQEDTMLNAIPGLPSGVIGFEVTGKLDAEDYRDTLTPQWPRPPRTATFDS